MSKSFLIGTSGWTFDDWRGEFYPADIPKTEWLHYYASQFPIVELNATFYRNFKKEAYKKWFDTVPDNFYFVVKVSRMITHYKKLKNCNSLIKAFEKTSAALKSKRALMLLQLPPSMPYDLALLKKALLAFEHKEKVVVEFRNKVWLTKETKALLTELNCIFCITDSPVIHLKNWLTADIAYVRLHGHSKWFEYNYSFRQLKSIAVFVKKLKDQGAKEVYIFFNNDVYANAPFNAKTLQALLID